MKDFWITLAFGLFGVHKFRQGKIGMGFLYLFTMGLFAFGWMYDVVIALKLVLTDESMEERDARVKKRREINMKTHEIMQKANKQRDITPRCPKCGSTSLTAQKKGFRMGRAIVGSTVSLGAGALIGAAGSRKIDITCLNCGKKFKPGKGK